MADESTGSSGSKAELKKVDLAVRQAAAAMSSGPMSVPGPQHDNLGWDAGGLHPQPWGYQNSNDPYDFDGGMESYDPFLLALRASLPPGPNPFAPAGGSAGGGYDHLQASGAGDPFGLGAGGFSFNPYAPGAAGYGYGFDPFDPFGMDPYGDDDDPFAAIAAHYGLPPPPAPNKPVSRHVPDPIPPFGGMASAGGNPFGSEAPSKPGLAPQLPPPHTVPPVSSKHAGSKEAPRNGAASTPPVVAAAAPTGGPIPKAAAPVAGSGSNPPAAPKCACDVGGGVVVGASSAAAPAPAGGGAAPPALPFDLSSVSERNRAANAGPAVGAPVPAEVRRAFAAVDVERCGYVDARELRRSLPIIEQQLGTGLSRVDTEALLQKYDAPLGDGATGLLLDVAEFSRLMADLRALARARADAPAFPARPGASFPRPGALPKSPLRRDVQINVAASAAAAAKAAAAAAASAATTAAMLSQCEAGAADRAEHRAAASKAAGALEALRKAANAVRAANGFATLAGNQPLGSAEPSLTQSLEAMQQAVHSVSAPAIAAAEEAAGSAATLFESLGASADGTVSVFRLRGALASLAGVADVRDMLDALGRFDHAQALSLHQYAQVAREVKVARQMRTRAANAAGAATGEPLSSGVGRAGGDSCVRGGTSGGRTGAVASVGRVKPPPAARLQHGAADWHPSSGGMGGGRQAGAISEEAMWEDLRTTKRLLRQMAREPGGPLERAGACGGPGAAASHALQATARLEQMHAGRGWAEFAADSWSLEDSGANRPLLADVAALLFDFPQAAVRVVATQPASSSSAPDHARSFRRWFPKEDMDTQATVAQGRAVSCRRVLLNSGIDPARVRTSATVSSHSLQPGAARRVHFVFEPVDGAEDMRRARDEVSAGEGTGRGGAGAVLTHTTAPAARYSHTTTITHETPVHHVSDAHTGSYGQTGSYAPACSYAHGGSDAQTGSSASAPTGPAWGELGRTWRGASAPVDAATRAVAAAHACSESQRALGSASVQHGRAVNKTLSWGRGAVSAGAHLPQAAAAYGSAAGGWSNGLVDSSAQRLAAARSYALRPTERASLNYTRGGQQTTVPQRGQPQAGQLLGGQSMAQRHVGQPPSRVETEPGASVLNMGPDASISGAEAAAQSAADVRQLRAEMQQLRAEMGRAAATRPRPSVHDIQIVTLAPAAGAAGGFKSGGRPRPGSACCAPSGGSRGRGDISLPAGYDAPADIGWAAVAHGGIPVRGAPGGRCACYRSTAERERDILSVSMLPSDDPRYRMRY